MSRPRATPLERAAGQALALLVVVLVGLPLACVAWRMPWSAKLRAPDVALMGSTLLWSLGVALLATLLALAPARWIAARGFSRSFWLLVPLMLPSYLAYSGLGLLRAPGTALGDAIERLGRTQDWAPVLIGRVLAAVGLAFWVWPLCACVIGAGLRRIDPGVADSLALEAGSSLRRWAARFRVALPHVLAGFGVAWLLMLGSAVPFHLAQVPTYAIRVWFDLTQDPGGASAWLSAWPTLLAPLVAGVWVSSAVLRSTSEFTPATALAPARRGVGLATRAIWAASAVVPLALYVWSLHAASDLGQFVRNSRGAILQSAQVAAIAGLAVAVIAMLTWIAFASRSTWARTSASWFVRSAVVVGLVPGILVGSAWLQVGVVTGSADGLWPLVAAHVARFAWVGALAGVWMAWLDGQGSRDARVVDGAQDVRGWWSAAGVAQAGLVCAVGIAAGMLSLHEIEATIVVQPPGPGSLSHKVLGYLHLWRQAEMSAAAVWLGGLGLVIGVLAAGLAGRKVE